MSAHRFDINTVRLGNLVRFEISGDAPHSIKLVMTHTDLDEKVITRGNSMTASARNDDGDLAALHEVLKWLPPIDTRAPDGSRLVVCEVRRDGSLVEGADRVQRVWRALTNQWTQDADDLRVLRALTSITFIAR